MSSRRLHYRLQDKELHRLQQEIGYTFVRRELLIQALTHVSKVAYRRELGNQRLEFLGDRVLGLAIAELLFERLPDSQEGILSQMLSHIVRKEHCAQVSERWGVGPCLYLGTHETREGAMQNLSILGDTCEAILGAIYLDSDFVTAKHIISEAFGAWITSDGKPFRDAKSLLQEWAMQNKHPIPTYSVLERNGPDHSPTFHIQVSMDADRSATAYGKSKRLAEQEAAKVLLEHIYKEHGLE